jgi:hypothetical protein
MPETKELTLMFFMASDNPLAISIVSQLKAIKAAGFHHQVNVIAQFDPFTEGTPTHIFDVNLLNKLKEPDKSNIGFGTDSLVRNLIEDKLWRDETSSKGERLIRDVIKDVLRTEDPPLKADYNPPMAPELNGSPPRHGGRRYEPDPYTSLQRFLNFCAEKYPANHYMLFMLGHGVVVGNDIFMFDEHAEKQSITLGEMGDVLRDFKEKIEEQEHKPTFDLVSFHSCSVSSLEVAYELKDTANYMLASQGPTFVGSWPYRQILIHIFKDLDDNGKMKDIDKLLKDIFDYCHHNSADFLLAGYSHQLTLCDLRRISDLNEPLEMLSTALINGLKDDTSKLFILYAHWKAQSFFQEMYTDLYDFCLCICDRYDLIPAGVGAITPQLEDIKVACEHMLTGLAKQAGVVVKAEFAGPAYQYSNGLSVYFPWTEPSEDSHILQQYKEYKFSQEFTDSWLDFLKAYFDATRRFSRMDEQGEREKLRSRATKELTEAEELQEDIVGLIYGGEGPLGGFSLSKSDPKDRTGGDCDCPSFKNYPRDTRARGERRKRAQGLPVSQPVLGPAQSF